MRLLHLVLLSGFWSAASAQEVPFRPLAIGDQWTFAARVASSPTATSCTLPDADTHYLRADVLRDTTVAGAEARVVRCTKLELDGQTSVSSETVAIPVAFQDNPDLGACSGLFAGRAPYGSPPGTYPVDIGDVSTPMNRLAFRPENVQGSGGFYRSNEHRYGDRVGLYAYRFSYAAGSQRGCSESQYSLVSAVVGGVAYGRGAVAVEPSPAASVTLHAFPTPARSSVRIESEADTRLEVVDALGRRVAVGDAAPGRPLRLDVSAWPAGLYVARTSGGDSVRLVVAR